MCICLWILTVWSSFLSTGDDVSVGSTCSSDPPALPTYPWPLPPRPSGACIYGEHDGTCSISLEMQMQTYLVQTVDSGWVQIRPVLLPKRERDNFHKSGCLCVFVYWWEDTRLMLAFFFSVRLAHYVVKDPALGKPASTPFPKSCGLLLRSEL